MYSNAGKKWEAYLPTVLATGDEGWLEISTKKECSVCGVHTQTNEATYVVAKADGTFVNHPLSVCDECAFDISDGYDFGFGEKG